MLGTIFYALGCFAAAMILSSIIVMTRSIEARDEAKPWKTFIFMFIFCLAAPFGYCEILTRAYGKSMESAINKAYDSTPCNGPLRYYRVVSCHKDEAHALVVGTDNGDYNVESPVISVNLVRDKKGNWKPDTFKVLTSGRLNQDAFVFPPYY